MSSAEILTKDAIKHLVNVFISDRGADKKEYLLIILGNVFFVSP